MRCPVCQRRTGDGRARRTGGQKHRAMVSLTELVSYVDVLLKADEFQDCCPNGLQVEGRGQVRRLVSGVTASLGLLKAAVAHGADAILVHHGYFWRGEDPRVLGMRKRRLGLLLKEDVSLLAYHLPLDAHPDLGNNAQLARVLGLAVRGRFGAGGEPGLAMHGTLPEPMSGEAFAKHVARALGREPLHIPGRAGRIATIGWCGGAAQNGIERAVDLGLDAYLTGEVSEPTVHVARECGIHFFAAGHHATERYGVQALGEHLAERFGLEHRFIDIDNPA